MPAPSPLYRTITWAAHAALAPAALLVPKLRSAIERRAHDRGRLAEWRRTSRDPDRPLVHLHAASAGELRQAEPVLRRLRARHPHWQVAVTCFSPTGIDVAHAMGADLSTLLPWDRPEYVRHFLDAVQPQVSVVCKLDLWPEFILAAHSRGVRLGLFAATVRPGSTRLGWIARSLTRTAYAALERVAAIDAPDGHRLLRLGVRADAMCVLGEPRADAVLERLQARAVLQDSTSLAAAGPALVAGSTWRQDESVLLGAWALVRQSHPNARLLLVPHEPTDAAWHHIVRRAAELGLPDPMAVEHATTADLLLVERRVGMLALIYGSGTIGYVGGGFGNAGLHSVLEPAGWSLPVITGPRWSGNRDAERLQECGGLVPLPAVESASALARVWCQWLENDGARREAGMASRRALDADLGAADRITDWMAPLFDR